MNAAIESGTTRKPPFPPETPRSAIGPVVTEMVLIDGRKFAMRRPAEPDRLLDNPAVIQAFERDEYMPYWADLWPAARMLAKALLRETWPPGLDTLELGCGLGLPGVVALSLGLRVTFSDYDATALQFAAENARLNGLSQFHVLRLDWRQPPELHFPLILAADLLYEERNVEPVVGLLQKMLPPDGVCLLTDQDRKPAPLLRQCLSDHGFAYATELMRAGQPTHADMPRLRVKGTLYRIRRKS